MKRSLTAVAIGLCASGTGSAASAGGIDLNGQPTGFIFEKGSYLELSFGGITTQMSGTDAVAPGGPTGNVVPRMFPLAFSYKTDLTDRLSFGLLIDQPFGSEIEYGLGSVMFGGTNAKAEISAMTALMRYKFSDRISLHGGLRAQTGTADITLIGAAYQGLSGYNATLSRDTGFGYVAGIAYEIPEYFLRVALTYNSEITHEFDTVESIGGFVVSTMPSQAVTPQSVNLDFQSGVAPDTFLFGGARWVEWSAMQFDPPYLLAQTGQGLVSFEDTISYNLGIGRQFSENWTGLFSLYYEDAADPFVSPLTPSNGFVGAAVTAVYSKDNLRLTAGVNYTKLGDATPKGVLPGVALADFSGNYAVGFGLKLGYSF